MYEAIIRPRLLHGAVVWCQRCTLKTHQSSLAKVQRLAIEGITGSPSTITLAALELILGIPPLQAFIKCEASKTWSHDRDVMGTGSGLDRELGQLLSPDIEASGCDKVRRRIYSRNPTRCISQTGKSEPRVLTSTPNRAWCGTQMVPKMRMAWEPLPGRKVALRCWCTHLTPMHRCSKQK